MKPLPASFTAPAPEVAARWELAAEPALQPFVLRILCGCTPLDRAVDAMPLPPRMTWQRHAVWLLRAYRRWRPGRIGRRCVCDPSCSRYAELALCRFGLREGLGRTLRRLHRCRPGHGGLDLPWSSAEQASGAPLVGLAACDHAAAGAGLPPEFVDDRVKEH